MDLFPSLPGSYAISLFLRSEIRIPVGKLGRQVFCSGNYLYLGSAQGSGGLRGRLRHHLRVATKPHWHIDWLREYAQPTVVWYVVGLDGLECAWSQAAAGLPGAFIPAPGFGASDCRCGCRSHLVRLAPGTSPALVEDCLGAVCLRLKLARVEFEMPQAEPDLSWGLRRPIRPGDSR